MKIIDSNLLIYSANEIHRNLRLFFVEKDTFVSSISKIEVLGYTKLTLDDKQYFEALFRNIQQIPISDTIIDRATLLRQKHSLSVGDAIIAATAMEYNAEIYTRNTKDFIKIKGIKCFNPIV